MASKTTHPGYNVATDQIAVSNQAYNSQYNQGWAIYPQGLGGTGTGTLTPYPYGGVLISGGGGAAGPLWPQQMITDTVGTVPYVTIDTRIEFSEEEIMRAEQIMEECDAARTP